MRILKQAPAAAIPRISIDLCLACADCLARSACDSKAIVRVDRDEQPWVDASRCFGCRACIVACPFGAVVLDTGSAK